MQVTENATPIIFTHCNYSGAYKYMDLYKIPYWSTLYIILLYLAQSLTLNPTSPFLQQRQVRSKKMKASRPEQEISTTAYGGASGAL